MGSPTENIVEIFLIIWNFLDLIFNYVTNMFIQLFDAIPLAAIPFLIGIACYSILALFNLLIELDSVQHKKLIIFFYVIFVIFMILFSFWRIGIVSQISGLSIFEFDDLITIFVNLSYIIFAVILFIAFYVKIDWLKQAIIILLWVLFLVITFVISPALEQSTLSSDTLTQVLIVGLIFIVPNTGVKIQNYKKKLETGDEEF